MICPMLQNEAQVKIINKFLMKMYFEAAVLPCASISTLSMMMNIPHSLKKFKIGVELITRNVRYLIRFIDFLM